MRTTLAIDEDVLAAARHLAQRDQQTLGAALSALARQGLARSAHEGRQERNGIPLLPTRAAGNPARPVTLEQVNQLRDELP